METIAQLNRALSARYRVEREIGSGGMATVFAAEDVRHGRRVALKVLKPELAAALGVDRFLAEIRVTATLQHPNLVPLFDSGDADGMLFYVMPLIEGESLRARLDRERQLPVEEAVRIGSAVAAALDYAHARGVIHRDLKPENILLQAGEPMVADFGIALAVSVAGGQRVTQTGLSLGTPQYMSPEQATGDRRIDARTDIYSLGAVIYEMLTAEPPHIGGTVQAIIARVINEPAKSVRVSRPLVPEHVGLAVDKALEKVPADRWSTARELADALHGRLRIAASASATKSIESQRRAWGVRHAVGVGLLSVGVAVGAIAAVLALRGRVRDDPTVEFSIASDRNLTMMPVSVAVSPDSRTVAFTAAGEKPNRELFVRALNDPTVRVIEGSEDASAPAFSPDGRWIAFWSFSRKKIVRAPVAGGPPSDIADIARMGRLNWTRDDRLVFTTGGLLATVPASGGVVSIVSRPDSASGEYHMQNALVIDDGQAVVYASISRPEDINGAELAVTSIAGGPHVRLGLKGIIPLQVLGGTLTYVRSDGALMGVAFDARNKRVRGQSVPLRKGIGVVGINVLSALSPNGTLVFMKLNEERELVWVDERGNVRLVRSDHRTYALPRVSPDGTRILVFGSLAGSRSGQHSILDIRSGSMSLVSSDTTVFYGEWSAEGRAILSWRSADSSITSRPADASSSPSRVLADGKFHYFAVHPNGRQLVYTDFGNQPNSEGRLMLRNISGDTTSHRLEGFPGGEWAYRFSPDGRWLAYVSNESGVYEVYVRPFPGPGARTQVSQGGGTEPVWAPDGARIYYRDANERVMYAVEVRTSATAFQVLRRTTLFEGDFGASWDVAAYDVAHGASRELLMTRRPGGEKMELVVVTGLQQELRRRLQTP